MKLANQVNIMSFAISIFHLNPLVYPALCFRGVLQLLNASLENKRQCTEAGKIPYFINQGENLAFIMENSESGNPDSIRVSEKLPLTLQRS